MSDFLSGLLGGSSGGSSGDSQTNLQTTNVETSSGVDFNPNIVINSNLGGGISSSASPLQPSATALGIPLLTSSLAAQAAAVPGLSSPAPSLSTLALAGGALLLLVWISHNQRRSPA